MTPLPNSGLDEFRAVIADYKSIGPWAIGGALFVPLVDYLLRLGPPWPEGIAVITSVAELLILMCLFHFGFRAGYKRVSRRMGVSLVTLSICFGAYLCLNSRFTYIAGAADEKFVKGFILRPDVAPLIGPDFTTDDALAGSEYRAESVWTDSSITAMRLILFSLWLSSFCSLATTIASFVIYHRRRLVSQGKELSHQTISVKPR